jgi:hypothetical protein
LRGFRIYAGFQNGSGHAALADRNRSSMSIRRKEARTQSREEIEPGSRNGHPFATSDTGGDTGG